MTAEFKKKRGNRPWLDWILPRTSLSLLNLQDFKQESTHKFDFGMIFGSIKCLFSCAFQADLGLLQKRGFHI